MMTVTMAAFALMGVQADKWELKAPLVKDAKDVYRMTIDVDFGGQSHAAKFTATSVIGERATDETAPVKLSWSAITVDEGDQPDLPTWTLKVDKAGAVTAAAGDLSDDYRRMVTPLYFIYPGKAVGAGDKWQTTLGKTEPFVFDFEAKGIEKVKADDAMRIDCKFKEGEKGMSGDGTYWVAKDGKVVKYEMKLKNWVMAFNENGPASVDAKVTGTRQ